MGWRGRLVGDERVNLLRGLHRLNLALVDHADGAPVCAVVTVCGWTVAARLVVTLGQNPVVPLGCCTRLADRRHDVEVVLRDVGQ